MPRNYVDKNIERYFGTKFRNECWRFASTQFNRYYRFDSWSHVWYVSWKESCFSDCSCNIFGSVRDDCEQMTGRCVCKSGITGQKCNLCENGKRLGPQGCSGEQYRNMPTTGAIVTFSVDAPWIWNELPTELKSCERTSFREIETRFFSKLHFNYVCFDPSI